MPFGLSLELFFPDKRNASIALNALLQETNSRHERRSKTAIKANKNIVLIDISAADKAAFRATTCSTLKLAALVEEILGGEI